MQCSQKTENKFVLVYWRWRILPDYSGDMSVDYKANLVLMYFRTTALNLNYKDLVQIVVCAIQSVFKCTIPTERFISMSDRQ